MEYLYKLQITKKFEPPSWMDIDLSHYMKQNERMLKVPIRSMRKSKSAEPQKIEKKRTPVKSRTPPPAQSMNQKPSSINQQPSPMNQKPSPTKSQSENAKSHRIENGSPTRGYAKKVHPLLNGSPYKIK